MPYPRIPGLEVLEESAAGCRYAVGPEVNDESILAILKWLPQDHELGFYDQYYPSMSDPGAYVSIQSSGGLFVYRMGNHGWSSDILKQSPELLAAWIMLNRKPKGPAGQVLKHLEIRLVPQKSLR